MATAHEIRDPISKTTTGSVRPRVPREVRDEVCRYAARRREEGVPWAAIARETGLDVRKLQRWNTRGELLENGKCPVRRMCYPTGGGYRMSHRMRTGILRMANFVVALAFLLGAGGVQAQVQFDTTDTTRAIGIDNLIIDGTTYDVDFTGEDTVAAEIYGDFPGTYEFPGETAPNLPESAPEAAAAVDAVNAALTGASAEFVGGVSAPLA